jgi:hypothetical protein
MFLLCTFCIYLLVPVNLVNICFNGISNKKRLEDDNNLEINFPKVVVSWFPYHLFGWSH